MEKSEELVSKVLILDSADNHDAMKDLCESCGLVGIKPHFTETFNIMVILRSNIDLGGILLHENFNGEGLDLAREIRECRPELPIFLRRDTQANLNGLAPKDAAMFRCAFTANDVAPLRATLEDSIFSRVYPNALVRGITEMTLAALQTLFSNCDIRVETPYLIKDRIIYGSVFSMITIESHWCRGYMMFQTLSKPMLSMIKHSVGDQGDELNFRELNNLLGEATNLVWGAFKNRYVRTDDTRNALMQTQVPIIVNQDERYISFGSEDPQLCLKYTLTEKGSNAEPVTIMQRFIFNLSWSPEDFSENEALDSLFESGELEMF